jgi:topoisomerase-4 subunit A
LNEKKLPLVGDVRDESAEDIRLVIEPKSRTVDPELMMESLFRLTELESKISLNLNVLLKGRIPRVVGLAECLREWLDHLRDVLVRRSNYRKEQIEHRIEILGGYLIAYLNIDKVIKIIRTEDEPKPVLMKTFKLTEVQADAILNMRLRSLRKLEEMEIKTEDKNLRNELKGIKSLLGSETEQWAKVGEQVKHVRDMFGPKTPLGKRRTTFADAPEHDLAAIEEAFVEREPVTIVISEKGWVRTLKGHVADLSGLTFKTDDKLDHAFFAETTSKLLLFATNGKFYSLDVAKLPGGRGHGEPIRMFIDLEQDAAIVSLFVNKGDRKFLIASSEGQGFVVKEEDCVGNTRKGKQVLNVEMPNEARAIATVSGDTVAAIGTNHKMVLFPLDQVPEMARGRGVRLQKYSSASLSDVAVFDSKQGLTWKDSAGRDHSMTMKELADWRGNRADAGRLAHGLPKSNKFNRGVE